MVRVRAKVELADGMVLTDPPAMIGEPEGPEAREDGAERHYG